MAKKREKSGVLWKEPGICRDFWGKWGGKWGKMLKIYDKKTRKIERFFGRVFGVF